MVTFLISANSTFLLIVFIIVVAIAVIVFYNLHSNGQGRKNHTVDLGEDHDMDSELYLDDEDLDSFD